jgi:DNA-directed RNA polymerase sigma subunit (sigma70/sigma32)
MITYSLCELDLDRQTENLPLDVLLAAESSDLLSELIASLPSKESSALLARFGFGDTPSVAELSDLWNCSRQFVYQCADKAIARLRLRLKQQGYYDAPD